MPGSVTEIVEDNPLQMVAGAAAMPVGMEGAAFTFTVTLAQAVEIQPVVVFRVRAK